jgi:hypothetical protein
VNQAGLTLHLILMPEENRYRIPANPLTTKAPLVPRTTGNRICTLQHDYGHSALDDIQLESWKWVRFVASIAQLTPSMRDSVQAKDGIRDTFRTDIEGEQRISIVHQQCDWESSVMTVQECTDWFILSKLIVSLLSAGLSVAVINTLSSSTPI